MSNNPMNKFFSLGPKDPIKKAQYDYYLFWVVFLAFGSLSYLYFKSFFINNSTTGLFWGIIMLIIMYFNFHTLKMMRNALIMIKRVKDSGIVVDNKEKMMEGFV